MRDHGMAAICCGNCAWTGCDSYSKALQVKRLQQAKETGSDLLVTACPKCQIHLRCAMEDPILRQRAADGDDGPHFGPGQNDSVGMKSSG